MNMFLQIQFQSSVKRNAVWNDLRESEQVVAIDEWKMMMNERDEIIGICTENTIN
jgi:hypothetical protein